MVDAVAGEPGMSGTSSTRYDPRIHHRQSIRLPHYDYAAEGAYFVTICVQDRECLFGEVVDGEMVLSEAGRIVDEAWNNLSRRFPFVDLDAFVVMPNHIHGIVVFREDEGAASSAPTWSAPAVGALLAAPSSAPPHSVRPPGKPARPTLGQIMRAFKSISAISANRLLGRQGQPLWQRNYYEHIIRDDDDPDRIREYIHTNPAMWDKDALHPDNLSRW